METYSVTVNGVTYDVQVEKKNNGSAGISAVPPVVTAPVNPPAAAMSKPIAAKPIADGMQITAGAAGKIWKIVVKEGQAVKAGAPIVILEAMKMEIPVVAPRDGVIAQILTSEGDSVEAGDLLATMNG